MAEIVPARGRRKARHAGADGGTEFLPRPIRWIVAIEDTLKLRINFPDFVRFEAPAPRSYPFGSTATISIGPTPVSRRGHPAVASA